MLAAPYLVHRGLNGLLLYDGKSAQKVSLLLFFISLVILLTGKGGRPMIFYLSFLPEMMRSAPGTALKTA